MIKSAPHACLAVNTLASEHPSANSLLLGISDQQKGIVNIATRVGPYSPDTSMCLSMLLCFHGQPFLTGMNLN